MKALKWILGIFGGLVLLAVVAVAAALMLLDTDKMRHEVEKAFQEKTGHALTLGAPIDWSIFPWVGLKLADVTVGPAPGFDKPLAKVEKLDVKVALMPLLERRIAVDTLVAHDLAINLEKDAKGHPNWAGLAEAGSASAEVKTAPEGKEQATGPGFQFQVAGLEVRNLNLSYDDRQKGQSYRVEGVDLTMGEVTPGKPVPIELALKYHAGQPPVDGRLKLNTDLTFSEDFSRVDLQGLAVLLAARGDGLPKGGMEVKLAADVGLDTQAGRLAVSNLSLSGPEVNLTGAVSVDRLFDTPAPEGRLQLQKTNLRKLLALFGIKLETADPKVLSALSAKLAFKGQGQGIEVAPLEVQLDDSRLDGTLELVSFDGPVVRAQFKLDAIDLDRYLPPPGKKEKQAAAEKGKAGSQAKRKPVDFAPLRRLDADVKVAVGHLKAANLKLDDIQLHFQAKKGVLKVDPLTAALYGGKLASTTRLDVRHQEPALALQDRISGIQIEPLLKDLAGKDFLTGTGGLSVNLTTRGLEDAKIRRNLNGKFRFKFENGTYKGFNITYAIRKARAALQGKTIPDEPQKTDFAELSASGVIRQGVMRNEDFYLASPILRVKGKGRVDLVQEQIDYRVTAMIVGTLKGQGAEDLKDLKGIPIPVRIHGALADPSVSVDTQALAKELAKGRLKKQKDKLLEKATKKLQKKLPGNLPVEIPGGASGLLKGFLGQ